MKKLPLDRLPNHKELFECLVSTFSVFGIEMSPERQIELAGIVRAESSGILNWILEGLSPAQSEIYLRRVGAIPGPTGGRFPGRN